MANKRVEIKKGKDPVVDAVINQYNARAFKYPDGSIVVEYPDGVSIKWENRRR